MKEPRDYRLYFLCVLCCCLSLVLAAICYLSLPFQRPLRIAIIAERLNRSGNPTSTPPASFPSYDTKLKVFPKNILDSFQNPDNYEEITNVWRLPRSVFELCGDGKMANPNQSWESTDMISDLTLSLPSRRLIWAASVSDGKFYIIHYETGGFAHYNNFVLASFSQGTAKLLWYGQGGSAWNYEKFLQELSIRKFNEHRAFSSLRVDDDPVFRVRD